MCRPHITLYTKRQVQLLMDQWGCKEPLPKKGKRDMICRPQSMELYAVDLIEIEKTDRRSDTNEQLWTLTQSSAAGRGFSATIQEGHVVDFINEKIRRRRELNLARHQSTGGFSC